MYTIFSDPDRYRILRTLNGYEVQEYNNNLLSFGYYTIKNGIFKTLKAAKKRKLELMLINGIVIE